MELYRRVTLGRLSEIFGERTLPIDRRFLTLGLRAAAEAEWQRANPAVRAALERYSAGVNAVAAAMIGRQRPLEFQLLRITPAPWTPVDSLAVAWLLAWRLAENHQAELVRAVLAERFGQEKAQQLAGRYPAECSDDYSERRCCDRAKFQGSRVPRFQGSRSPRTPESSELTTPWNPWNPGTLGTCSWPRVAGGGARARAQQQLGGVRAARRRAGGPMLANDPHLQIEFPSVWYEMHLVSAGLDVAGVSIPGTPFIVLGHNARVAWGLTNTGADVQDLYLERIDVARKRVMANGQWVGGRRHAGGHSRARPIDAREVRSLEDAARAGLCRRRPRLGRAAGVAVARRAKRGGEARLRASLGHARRRSPRRSKRSIERPTGRRC